MNITEFIPYINFFGFLALGVAMIIVQWKTGATKVASEVIDTYKTQVQQLREELEIEKKGREDDRHELKNQIQALALQVEHMKGANAEKDKKISDLSMLLQGRSPEQEQFMIDMRNFTQGVAQYMKDSAEILKGMKTFMEQLNETTKMNAKKVQKLGS